MTQPDAAHPAGRDEDATLTQFIANPDLAMGGKVSGVIDNGSLGFQINPVLRVWHPPGLLQQRVHTAFFDSIEAVADAKAEILEGLAPGGAAVLNADDPLTARIAARAAEAGWCRTERAVMIRDMPMIYLHKT